MEKQEVTFNYGKSEGSHEVYLVVDTSTNTLLYIGHGAAGRHKHTYSGTSHVYGLNYEHFKGTPINIRVVPFAEKEDANLVESYLIAKLQPKYNRAGLMKSLSFLKELQKPIDKLKASFKGFHDLNQLLSLKQKDFKDLREERLASGKKPSTKDMVEIFKTDPKFILKVDPDLHLWLSTIGLDKAEALQFRRASIKSFFDKETASNIRATKQMLKHWFKVGNAYVPDEIKLKVHLRTGIVPKSTQEALKVLRKYYEVVPTNIKGQSGYKIVRIL